MTTQEARDPWWRRHGPVLVGAAAMLALLLPRGEYVPIWDGRIYADCVIDAALEPPWELSRLACAGHPTLGWALPHALAQRLSPGSTWLLLVVNLGFALVGLQAFHRWMRRVFPAPSHRAGVGLMTVALAVHPTVLASTLQPNPDLGVYAFSLAAFAALAERRLAAATLWGTALALSKETGAMLWGIALAVEALTITRGPGSVSERLQALRARLTMVTPLLALGAWMAHRALIARPVLWTPVADAPSHILHDFLSLSLDDRVFHASLALTAVMSFAWLAALPVVVDLARRAWAWVFREALPPVDGADPRALGDALAMAALAALALTRYRTFANPRYFLPLHPLLLLASYAALCRPRVSLGLRRAVPAALAALFAASCVRTIDPLSRAVFGTFSVGQREMLFVTRIPRECCGYGRDQLVYDLEFTRFDELLQRALVDLRPDARRRVAWSHDADWFIGGAIDRRTGRRTLRREGVDELKPLYVEALLAQPPPPGTEEVILLRLAYAQDDGVVEALRAAYDLTPLRTYAVGGFELRALRVTPRAR